MPLPVVPVLLVAAAANDVLAAVDVYCFSPRVGDAASTAFAGELVSPMAVEPGAPSGTTGCVWAGRLLVVSVTVSVPAR